MATLPCLSIRQPYALAVVRGLKREEYRTFRTRHRGRMLVHASLTLEPAGLADYPSIDPGECWGGCLLGTVEVLDCRELGPRSFAWVLANPRAFAEPIACTGRTGVWPVEVEDGLLR